MNQSLIRRAAILCISLFIVNTLLASSGDPASITFNFNSCNAWIPTNDNYNFSEFTGLVNNTEDISMSVVGGNLYRLNPEDNGHSCTQGLNGTDAMCVSAEQACMYDASSEKSVKFDIQISPTANKFVQLSSLNFYEMAPEFFSWNDGFSYLNDYPTRYALRVMKNGSVIYELTDVQTTQEWTLESYDFSGEAFKVGETTTFNFELIAYCPIGANSLQKVWDLEDVKITTICLDQDITNGGEVTGGPYSYCLDGDSFFVSSLGLFSNFGQNNEWLITDESGTILALPDDIQAVNFAALGGTAYIQNIAYQNGLTGLEIGNNTSDLSGAAFSISNSVSVSATLPSGGNLTGGPFSFCIDGEADFVDGISIDENAGTTMQWIVTDGDGLILGLPANIEDVNFDDAGVGSCLIWNVSYETISGLSVGSNISGLEGCFDVSNNILVDRLIIEGGSLSGGPYEFCIDDTEDFISDFELTDVNASLTTTWIITDIQLNILGVPADPSTVNFNDAGAGICFLWAISSSGAITGAEVDNTVSDIVGCYDISNSIQISRIDPQGGTLEGGPFEFCVDGEADMVSGVSVSGTTGEDNQWVVTDQDGTILGLPDDIENVDFDEAGIGICLIWNVSFTGELTELELDNDITDIGGCYGISDSIEVVRSILNGGTLEGGPFNFCVDGVQDTVSNITLDGDNGANSTWVITDEDGVILGTPTNIESVDFDEAGGGICFIYNLSYQDGLSGLEMGANIDTLSGCFGFSNSIAVNRTNPIGGTLEGGPFEFCLDGTPDMVTGVSVIGNAGVNSSWLITDTTGVILGLTTEIDTIDFNGVTAGICLIWNISFGSDIIGLEVGEEVADLEGCFAISSNSIEVTRIEVEGGTLSGGPYNFCLDEASDFADDLNLEGNEGANSIFLVTDEGGDILDITTEIDTIDFNGAPVGICLIWNISFDDGLTGLENGNNVSELEGCYEISNSVSVTRSETDGGVLTSDDFDFMIDGMPDMVSGIVVSDTIGDSFNWIVTDADLEILEIPSDIEEVNFDNAGVGICLIWYISYDGISGLETGNSLNDLSGCFDLSNSITVNRMASAGGVLEGGPFNFCVDGNEDMVSGLTLTGVMGTNSQYVITDTQDSIIMLPTDIEEVDFDGAGVGVCYIYHLSYEDNLMGLTTGNFLSDLTGGFALSNNLIVNRTQPSGGTLEGGPYSFCLDDVDDFVTDLVLTGNSGSNTQWIVTDADENIITVTDSIQNVNFNETGVGTCLIWSITYEDGINGLINQSPLNIVSGCFALSNSIVVNKDDVNGGILESAPFNFCIDMEMDTVSNINLAGATGTNNAWIVTDEEGNILDLPANIEDVDFNAAGVGICLIWNISYEDGLLGLTTDNNVSDLLGCFDLSNSITVTRTQPESGTIDGGPFTFTIDGIEDNVSGITLTGNNAQNEQWMVTTTTDTILALSDDIENINFDAFGVGECLISHVGFATGVMGLSEGNALEDIEGCFNVSNTIMVTKMASIGGTLTGGPFNFCIDGEPDFVSDLEIDGNEGSVNTWIITEMDGTIIELPNNIEVIDFDDQGVGSFFIYHISYNPMIAGLVIGNNISQVTGTFGISNAVVVEGSTPTAGTLTGGPFEFCINGEPDMVSGVTLDGNVGNNTSWVITDEAGIILGVPDTLENVNFDDAGSGTCLIYSISYNDGLEGLAVDSLLNNLEGCFELTNSLAVERTLIDGGNLTGGPFNFCIDDIADNVTGISLSGFVGPNISWVVTNELGVITNLVESLGEIDFNTTMSDTSFIYNIAFETGLVGLVEGASIDNLDGCFDFSDPIIVASTIPEGGTISGDAFEFCIDTDNDFVTDFSVSTDTVGTNFSWLITEMDGEIVSVPEDILGVNFNLLNGGNYLVWHIAYEDGIDGLFVGEDISDLEGCFDISDNNIMISIVQPQGGSLSPINFSFCKDGVPDFVNGLTLTDTVGMNFNWVITDLAGEILQLPAEIDTVDFDNSEIGTCLIYNLTSEDGLTGLTVGANIDDLDGCFDFSNSTQVIKEDCVLMSNDSIVINEIFADDNLVELKNVSENTIDVSEFWLCQFPAYGQLTNLALDCDPSDYILDPGEILVVEFNAALSPMTGEIGLYNSDLTGSDFSNSDFIVDYVEWGTPNHQRSEVAVEAGIWTAGDFVPAFSITNSIEYDGIGNSPFDWSEDSATLCTANNFNSPDPIEQKISLFPNPVQDNISVDFAKSPTDQVTLRVYNSFGKLIIQEKVNALNGETPNVDISKLNEGAYILEVSMKGFSQSKRFIKIN